MLLLCLMALASTSVGFAQTDDELYLQPDQLDGNTNYMDMVRPMGSEIKEATSRTFATRKVTAGQYYDHYVLRLWVTRDDREYVITYRIGWLDFLGLPHNITVPPGMEFLERTLEGGALTIFPHGGGLRITLSSERLFYWGSNTKPSSLVTNHGQYSGLPIPEFASGGVVCLLVTVFAVVTVATRYRGTRKEKKAK